MFVERAMGISNRLARSSKRPKVRNKILISCMQRIDNRCYGVNEFSGRCMYISRKNVAVFFWGFFFKW